MYDMLATNDWMVAIGSYGYCKCKFEIRACLLSALWTQKLTTPQLPSAMLMAKGKPSTKWQSKLG